MHVYEIQVCYVVLWDPVDKKTCSAWGPFWFDKWGLFWHKAVLTGHLYVMCSCVCGNFIVFAVCCRASLASLLLTVLLFCWLHGFIGHVSSYRYLYQIHFYSASCWLLMIRIVNKILIQQKDSTTATTTTTFFLLHGLCPGLPWWAGIRKVKPVWIYQSKR